VIDLWRVATFCLLHGDWHDGACWASLVAALRERGHEAVAPDMPYGDPGTGFEERTQPALDALEGASGQIVVVGSGPTPPLIDRAPVSLWPSMSAGTLLV
jgi:hypothetical protein